MTGRQRLYGRGVRVGQWGFCAGGLVWQACEPATWSCVSVTGSGAASEDCDPSGAWAAAAVCKAPCMTVSP